MFEHCQHGYLVGKCKSCDLARLSGAEAENERLTTLLAASESVRRNADARVAELGERLIAVTAENKRLQELLDAPPYVDCICAGCPRKVPQAWAAGMCGPCADEDCEHQDGAAARIAELEDAIAALRAALATTPENIERLGAELGLSTVEEVEAILQAITTRGEAAGGVEAGSAGNLARHAREECGQCSAGEAICGTGQAAAARDAAAAPAASQDVGTVGSGEMEP